MTEKLKLLEKKLKIIDHIIEEADTKNIDEKTISMYNTLQERGHKMIIANKTNPTDNRTKLIEIFKLIGNIILGKKTEPESKTHDQATGGYDKDEAIPLPPIPKLESEEKAEEQHIEKAKKVQSAKGLKITTPSQLITRLPILLEQLKAGNNSNKLKNEPRQIIYSFYSSKNYNHL